MTALALVFILVVGISFTLMKTNWFCLVEPIIITMRTSPAESRKRMAKSALLWAV